MSKAMLPSLDAPLWSRWFLSLLLPLIGLLIYWEGQDYDPGLVQLQARTQPLIPPLPEQLVGLPRFGQLRTYNTDNLYEYINGHAEYYLSAGFKALTVAEYAPKATQQPQLVINLYHMGEPLFAFGALMGELAPDAKPVDAIDGMAFAVGSGVNLILGPYYAQISSFDEQIDPARAGTTLIEAIILQGLDEAAELDLRFPVLGETVGTYFVKQDYRGLGFLHNVLERVFRVGEDEITAFLINGSPENISKTVKALHGFLRKDEIPFEQQTFEGMSYHLIDDPYEGQWFFVTGENRLLGAFAAPRPELLRMIKGDTP